MNASHYVWRQIDRIARQRVLSVVIVALLSFGGSWLWSLSRGIPAPYVFDEFSYLLAGDTFAHGRVTNPSHPMWVHFEAFNILQQPSYMSKYPPGQGIFLALGQVLFGHPIYGVWLSSAFMCAAICWMLYAWVSPRWALVGGLVAVLQFSVFTYWSQSYWGGAVAGIGGALVFGALPRIFRTQRIRDALWLGLGCAVLANSRPLEGFLVAMPVGCLVLPWKIRWQELVLTKFIKRTILPLSIILFITVLGMGAYNKKVTGDAGLFPHFLYDRTYSDVPLFIWQPLLPGVKFNHEIMERYEKYHDEAYYMDKRTWHGFVEDMQHEGSDILMFFFGYPLALPSLAVLLLFFSRCQTAVRWGGALLVLLGTCGVMTCNAKPHYFSPLTCLIVLLVVTGLRGLAGLNLRNARVGPALVIFLICLQFILNIFLTPGMPPAQSYAAIAQRPSAIHLPVFFTREELKNILMKRGGKYLVIVRYHSSHNYLWEWVYNDADIDHAPVVWARDMGEEQNKVLLAYFKDRQVLFIGTVWDSQGFPLYLKRQ